MLLPELGREVTLSRIKSVVSGFSANGGQLLLVYIDEHGQIQHAGDPTLGQAFGEVLDSFRRQLYDFNGWDKQKQTNSAINFMKEEVVTALSDSPSFSTKEEDTLGKVASFAGKRRSCRRHVDIFEGNHAANHGKVPISTTKASPSANQRTLRDRDDLKFSRKARQNKRKLKRVEKLNGTSKENAESSNVDLDNGISSLSETSSERLEEPSVPRRSSVIKSCSNRVQTEEKTFSCDTCGKTFTRRVGLVEHQRTHTGEKPFKCEVCPAAFSVVQNLKVHRRTHSGARPFQCAQCGRDFPRKANLIIHERSHSKEKPFSCEVCKKNFSQASCLKRHRTMHVGDKPSFECGNCAKTFTTKHYLTIHERTHTGERPFVCQHEGCGSAFFQKRHLRDHNRLHASGVGCEEKSFSCPLCSRIFVSSQKFETHRRVCGSGEGDLKDAVPSKVDAPTELVIPAFIDASAPAPVTETKSLNGGLSTSEGNDTADFPVSKIPDNHTAVSNSDASAANAAAASAATQITILPPQLLLSSTAGGVFLTSSTSGASHSTNYATFLSSATSVTPEGFAAIVPFVSHAIDSTTSSVAQPATYGTGERDAATSPEGMNPHCSSAEAMLTVGVAESASPPDVAAATVPRISTPMVEEKEYPVVACDFPLGPVL